MPWLPLAAAPKLSVEFDEADGNIFFLYPHHSELPPVADTTIAGRVILELPSAKRIRTVHVQLIGLQRFRFREKDVCVETLRRDLTVNIGDEELQPGKHEFAFSILVPANTAPSLHCELATTRYRLYATIPKLGRLGGDLQTVRKVGLQVNHSGVLNGPPPAHFYETQFLHDRLGPTLIEMSTKHCIIGGYLRWYISLAAMLLPFRILELTVDIVQHVRITPSLDVTRPSETREQQRTIYRLSQDELIVEQLKKVIRPGEDYANISRQMRIPFDEGPFIIASHHPDTLDCVSAITSELVLSLTFEQYEGGEEPSAEQLANGSRQLLQVRCPVVFSSCFCRLDYSKLPAYSPSDNLSLSRQSSAHSAKGKYAMNECMCKELGEEEEKEYGVSREEVHARWKAEQAGRAWLESIRLKQDGTAVAT